MNSTIQHDADILQDNMPYCTINVTDNQLLIEYFDYHDTFSRNHDGFYSRYTDSDHDLTIENVSDIISTEISDLVDGMQAIAESNSCK
jgi:hypothetical protein